MMRTTTTAPTRATRNARHAQLRDDRGATAVEYALLIGFVAVVMTAGVALLGGALSSGFVDAAERVSSASGAADAVPMAQESADEQAQDQQAAADQAAAQKKAEEQAAAEEWAADQAAAQKKAEEQAAAEKWAAQQAKEQKQMAECEAQGSQYYWDTLKDKCVKSKNVRS